MKRGGKIFEFLAALVRMPSLASAVVHDDRYWRMRFRDTFGHLDPLPVISFSDLVPAGSSLDTYTFLGGGSMITDLILLRHLAMDASIKSYFEIGTWRGESVMAVLPHVQQAHCLDMDEASMIRAGLNEQQRKQLGTLIRDPDEKITRYYADSAEFDFTRVGGPCDLIFIDGNHTADYVTQDTRSVFKHLVHEGSVVVWHDYARHPEQVRWEVYYAILKALPEEHRARLFHVSHTKCAVYLPHLAYRSKPAEFPQDITGTWSVQINRHPHP